MKLIAAHHAAKLNWNFRLTFSSRPALAAKNSVWDVVAESSDAALLQKQSHHATGSI